MPLQFRSAVEGLKVWIATSDDISFVISFASPTGAGFRGRLGYVASWRPDYAGRGAIKVIGSPFKNFADAEQACNAISEHLNYVPTIAISLAAE